MDTNESNLEIILDKMKDHVDDLDSMAQLEVIITPVIMTLWLSCKNRGRIGTKPCCQSRRVAITLVVPNDYMVQRTAKKKK